MSDEHDVSPYAPPASPAEPSPLNWKNWSPSQSDEVKQILAHMTPAESRRMTVSSMWFGLVFGLTFSVPVAMMMYGLSSGSPASWLTISGAILMAAHYLYVPHWVRRQKRLFCGTEWARENGITPETLPFHRNNTRTSGK